MGTGLTAGGLVLGGVLIAALAIFVFLRVLSAGIERYGMVRIVLMGVFAVMGFFVYVGFTEPRGALYFADTTQDSWFKMHRWIAEKAGE